MFAVSGVWLRGFAAVVVAVVALFGGAAHAGTGPWASGNHVDARLIAATQATGDLAQIPVGVQLSLDPGWKTYWRSPGDAGLPPRLDWQESENLASADLRWPAPHRFTLFGLETYGYDGEVVLPITVTPTTPGEPVGLKATLDVLVCSDICVPELLDLSLVLPAGPGVPSDGALLIDRFEARIPDDGRASGFEITNMQATQAEGGPAIAITATARDPFVVPDMFVETASYIAFAAPEIAYLDEDRRIEAVIPVAAPVPEDLDLAGLATVVTIVDGARAAEIPISIGGGSTSAAHGAGLFGFGDDAFTFASILALAVLGGFILNFMPCVLPVLSLKLLGVVGQGGKAPGRARAGFLASAAGIITSFLVLAGILIALQASGGSIGWGIQFQQPVFLAAMIMLLTLFAANLWGLFEITLPHQVTNRVAMIGTKPDQGESLGGHFLTGAFATLLATPCSAPFLGTAVGFALARGPAEILAVFLALGVGLALPYLAMAAWPRFSRLLPKPGPWMVRLKQVMGVALAATAIWLLMVMGSQGTTTALVVAVAALLVLGALAIWRGGRNSLRRPSALATVTLVITAMAVPAFLDRTEARATQTPAHTAWVAFDRDGVRSLVAQGKTVLVDVTAEWCLTCKANETLVLNRGEVAEALGDGRIIPMQADWTRPDPAITDYLASYGRYGIPFNILYGPGAPQGIVLPELLTESTVMEAFDTAGRLP